jgi:putative SOS response-associated peptidase YedK
VVLLDGEAPERTLETLRWGLVPFWAKDIKIGYSLINAKAETVAEKPAFRDALKSRRCLIAADGFYAYRSSACRRFERPRGCTSLRHRSSGRPATPVRRGDR